MAVVATVTYASTLPRCANFKPWTRITAAPPLNLISPVPFAGTPDSVDFVPSHLPRLFHLTANECFKIEWNDQLNVEENVIIVS